MVSHASASFMRHSLRDGRQHDASGSAQAEESQTPIRHVIVIIGENRTFKHIFATCKPVNHDEKVWHLLSRKSPTPSDRRHLPSGI
jgi:phospholipase C